MIEIHETEGRILRDSSDGEVFGRLRKGVNKRTYVMDIDGCSVVFTQEDLEKITLELQALNKEAE